MKRILFFPYQLCIWFPLFFTATVLCALITIIGCLIGDKRIFGYYPGKWWSRFVCFISLCPVTVKGGKNLSDGQSYIFTANHQGAYDIFLLYGYLGVPIKWIMKQSLRNIPLVGKACETAGFIFVDNSSPVAAAKTIRKAEQQLKNGISIAIFPEGSRTRTGRLGKFKKGGYKMALDMKLPIVPVSINGSYKVLPRHTFLLCPHRLELIIHEPIETKYLISNNLKTATVNVHSLKERSLNAIEAELWFD